MKKTFYLLLCAGWLVACHKPDNLLIQEDPYELPSILQTEQYLKLFQPPFSYQPEIPAYLGILGMHSAPIEDPKAIIGRVLFYDKKLSKDGKIACASCHKQAYSFSDNIPFSTGVEGRQTLRNATPLANTANFSAHYAALNGHQPLLSWNNNISDVKNLSRLSFTDPRQMDITLAEVVARVQSQPYYRYLWEQAYGKFEVQEEHVLECLQTFVLAMHCEDTQLDHALARVVGTNPTNTQPTPALLTAVYEGAVTPANSVFWDFDTTELRGRNIFIANCTKCHSALRSTQQVFEACNGLDLNYTDQGKGALTGNAADNGVFKAPSLRNIALTAPYMHDGRFKTLAEVVNFYNTGVQLHPNLHPLLRHNGNTQLNLSASDRQALVDFLKTLTDVSVLSDSRFSNPFR